MSNKVLMTDKKDQKQKIKVLTIPIQGVINLIMDMNEYPKLESHVKSFVLGMKTHLSRNEIK